MKPFTASKGRGDNTSHAALNWRRLATRDLASPKLWMDAYLAAFAIAAEAELVTTDTAFMQFEGLKVTVLRGS